MDTMNHTSIVSESPDEALVMQIVDRLRPLIAHWSEGAQFTAVMACVVSEQAKRQNRAWFAGRAYWFSLYRQIYKTNQARQGFSAFGLVSPDSLFDWLVMGGIA